MEYFIIKVVIAIKYFKRGLFDRADGWRVRNIDTMYAVIPFIMRTRLDSQNLFSDDIDLDVLNAFIRRQRKDLPDLSLMHVVMAALIRTISQRPYLNRFVVHNKIYARNHISISLTIKRSISDWGEETTIKPHFEPEDTLADVVRKVHDTLERDRQAGAKNKTDKVANVFTYLPAFVVRFGVFLLRWMDNCGILPKVIREASPFHTSVFLTNIATLRIRSIFHHLYEFGTCSVFCAIGKPERAVKAVSDETTQIKKVMGTNFVLDERVADGHYYAASMRYLYGLLSNPERLLVPPESVVVDDGVAKKRIDLAPS